MVIILSENLKPVYPNSYYFYKWEEVSDFLCSCLRNPERQGLPDIFNHNHW
jgi:hypothetical protein